MKQKINLQSYLTRLRGLMLTLIILCSISIGNAWGATYVKVTSASDLVSGQVYVIAEISGNTKYLVTGTGSKLVNTTSGFNVSNNTITTSTATPLEFTLGTVTSGNNTYYTLKYSSTTYLGYNSSTNFRTNQTATTDPKEQWSITSTNSFDIRNVSTLSANTKRRIARNSASIGPYDASSSSYPPCYLFKKQTSTCTNPTTALSISSANTATVGTNLSLTTTGGNGGSVTWSVTNGTGSATVSGSTLTPTGAGTVTVTATQGENTVSGTTYCGATPTQTINISNATFTVGWQANGTDWTGSSHGSPTTNVESGSKVTTLPTAPTAAACDGSKVFVGWTATPIVGTTNTKPSDLFVTAAAAPNVTENVTYYAVFAAGGTVTFDAATASDLTEDPSLTWTNSTSGVSLTITAGQRYTGGNPYTWSVNKGSYATVAITSGNIAHIEATLSESKYYIKSAGTGTLATNSTTQTITNIFASSVRLNAQPTGNSNNQIRMTTFDVTYVSATPAYETTCCTPPGTALSITGSTTVAMDGTLSLGTSGGNGNTVSWSVATLSGGNGSISSSGVLTPSAVGTVTVTASQGANSYCAQEATLTVTINAATVHVSSVSVDPTTKAIVPGETFTITPTVSPGNATDKSVTWNSGTPAKATVSNAGLVTGVAAGSSTITCTTTDGSKTATTAVTVYGVTIAVEDEDGTPISGVGKPTISRSGAAVTTAAAGNYVFKEWSVTNATLSGSTSTGTTITLPTGAVTVKAIYYKPITVTYWNNGVNVHEDQVAYGSNVTPTYSGVTSGGSGDAGPCDATHVYYVGWTKSLINGSTDTEPSDIGQGYNSVSTDVNFYAVWTDVDAEDYSSDYTEGTGTYAPEHASAMTLRIGDVSDIPAIKIATTKNAGTYSIQLPSGTTTLTLRARYWDSGATLSIGLWDEGVSVSPTSVNPEYGDSEFTGNSTTATLDREDDLYTFTFTGVSSAIWITLEASSSGRVVIYDINTSTGGGGGGGGSGDAEYITTCCSELGTIGGAVSSYTQTSVTLEWNKLSNVDGTTPYTVTASGGSVGAIDLSGAKATCTITGLSCNTAYTFGITAHGASGYCDKTQSGIAQTTSSYTVTYTITNGSKTSGETSTCGPLTAVFSANSGYHLPDKAAITVTGASDFSWTKATGTLTITAGQITGNISISFTCPADACTGVNSLHTGSKNGSDWLYNKCFSDVDWGAADDAIWVGEFPSTNECYVGWAGGDSYYGAYWAVGGIKTYDIPNGRTLGWNSSDYYNDYPATAIGTFHIYKNSTDANYYLRFKPTTYVLRTGSDGTSWTSRDMTVSGVNANYYESEFVTLTSTVISEHAYVDLKANNVNGHVWCNFSNDRVASGNVKVKNGASTFRATDLQAADNGTYGKFQIDITQDEDNWKLAFVPYYHITYNANGGTGSTAASSYVEVGSTAAAAANGFTAPTGKQFGGWATSSAHAAAGTVDYAAGASVTLNGDVELFAVWTDVNYTVTINQSPDVSATTTGQTSSAHYNGTIHLTTTVPDGYRFVNWTTSDGFSITNNTSATTASFTMPAKDVTVTANFERVYTVNWNVGGENTGWALAGGGTFSAQSPYNSGAALVVPGNPAVPVSCGEKSFVGWTSDGEILSETSTAPSFLNTESPGTVTADITYYAVFADGSSSTTYKWVRHEVTSGFGLSDLSEGTWALVSAAGYVFNGTMSSGHGQKTESAASFTNDEVASLPDGACQLTFTQVKDNGNVVGYTVYNSTYGYLYATKAGSGGLSWHSTETSYWKIASDNFVYNSNSAYLRVYDNTFRTYASASNNTIYLAKYTSVTVSSYDNYITTCSSCTTPSSLSVGSITSTSGTVSWSGVSIDDGFTVLWGTDATRANNSNSAHVASGTNEYEITGLTPATRYYVWVQSECDDEWSSSTDFYTNAKITYAAGTGASGSMDPKEVTYNTDVTVDACTFTAPSGKKFNGWVSDQAVTVSASSTTSVPDGATITSLTKAITLTAQWRDLASYTVNFRADNGTVAGGPAQTVYEDGKLTFPNVTSTTCGTFIGWIESSSYENVAKPSGATFHTQGSQIDVVPALSGKTYYAVYAEITDPTPTNDYVKIESDQMDWSGEYLIVSEYTISATNYSRVFKGSLSTLDAANNSTDVTISSKTIEATNTTNGYKFVISAVDGQDGKYFIKSATNYYIGNPGTGNYLATTNSTPTADYYNTIEYNAANSRVLIKGNNAEPTRLAYNSGATDNRFRYYSAPDSQKDIQLYKKGGGVTIIYKTSPSCSPTLQINALGLTEMSYVYGSGPSASQTFTAGGKNMTEGKTITVTAPTNFHVSKDNSSFSGSVSYPVPASGEVEETIYIRLVGGLNAGTYGGTGQVITVSTNQDAVANAVSGDVNGSVTKAAATMAFDPNVYEATYEGSPVIINFSFTLTGDGTVAFSRSPAANSRAVETDGLHTFTALAAGIWTITAVHTPGDNYSKASNATATVRVKCVDTYVDFIHNKTIKAYGSGSTVTDGKMEDWGSGYTVPYIDDNATETSGSCQQTHFKFVGWVSEDDINIADGTFKPGYTLIEAGTAGKRATTKTYYAVWAKQEE